MTTPPPADPGTPPSSPGPRPTPTPTPTLIANALTRAFTAAPPEWEPFCPGVERLWLFRTQPDAPSAALIRFEPGGRVPLHEHVASEYILILAGSQQDEHGSAQAGALIHNPAGSRHRIYSPSGCLVLALYERQVRFLEPLPPLTSAPLPSSPSSPA